jgi:hypothetical protein
MNIHVAQENFELTSVEQNILMFWNIATFAKKENKGNITGLC